MSHSVRIVFVLILSLLPAASLGCGGGGVTTKSTPSDHGPASPPPGAGQEKKPAVGAIAAQAPGAPPVANPAPAPVERKIIYTATLGLVVKDLDETTREVDKRLASQKGRLVRSEIHSDTGKYRSGTFTLEVPVEGFRDLLNALKELGTPERDAVDSQDVTEEFVDIQARLKNLRQQEDKLNELLKERRKEEKLEDIIRVSEKIYEVRQLIERVEGRLKYLEVKAAFSTIHLTLREIKDYKPPTAPTFGNRVIQTFDDSWDAVVRFSEWMFLAAVAIAPWLPILIPLGLVGWWLLRKLRRLATVREPDQPSLPQRTASGHASVPHWIESPPVASPVEPSNPDTPTSPLT